MGNADVASDRDRLPVRGLTRLGVVVPDLEEAMLGYAEILGIDQWALAEEQSRISELVVDGLSARASWRSAYGSTPSGQVRFELIQPLEGLSAAQLFRARRGPGIMQLTFTAGSPQEGAAVAEFFARRGVPPLQRFVQDGQHESVTYDTRELLGGYLVNYLVPLAEKPVVLAGPDRICDVSQGYTRPPGQGPLDVPRLHHVGIVVGDVLTAVKQHASVYDIDTWNFINWRPEQGRLESPFYRGCAVHHEYLTGRAFNFCDFGFELIQPTFGPSHYKDDFLDLVGSGIHHLLIGFPDQEERWEQTMEWLDSAGVPLVMGSEMRGGSGRFYYLDSRERLGGYVIEASFPRPGRKVVGPINDFSINYATSTAT
jgi:hypothetical protein